MRRAVVVALLGVIGSVVVSVPDPDVADAASEISCTPPTGAPSDGGASGGFVGRTPERLADTRAAEPVPEDCWLRVELPASVPADATAVALTVTSDRVPRPGFLTVHPCGSALPELSNLNIRTEGPNSNFAVVAVDDTREVCVYSDGGTDAIVDLVGHFGPGGARFQELEPRRVLDTRDPFRRPDDVTGPPEPRQIVTVDRDRLGVPDDASAVMVNLTVAEAEAPGFLTAYPCAGERPPTSNVNYEQGGARANTSIVALSAEGTMCIELDAASADVIVDLVGYFGSGADGLEYETGMRRVADSRSGLGGWDGPFAADQTRSFDPGLGNVMPDGTRVAVLGVVATRAEEAGFLQVRPCGSTADVSSVNYVPGVDITNLVVVPLDDDGTVCVTSSAPTDVVVDLFGGFRAEGLMRSLSVGPHEVFPDFRPDVHDYVAYCPNETGNTFQISARGMPGTRVELVGQLSGAPRLSTSATRAADQALTLRVIPEVGAAEEYWIRCLPPDFPEVTVSRPGDPEPGWYLLNNGSATRNYGIIVDTNGVPVWYRKAEPPAAPGAHVPEPRGLQRLSDGTLAWIQTQGFAFGIDPGNSFERFALDGTMLLGPSVEAPLATNHHELHELPNGNFLLTALPFEDAPPGTMCHTPRPGVQGEFDEVEADHVAAAVVQEVTPTNEAVWTWHSDPLDTQGKPDGERIDLDETTLRLCFVDSAGEYYLSAIHPNALDVRGDHVLISARHADAVYAVDRNTGEIDWKLGGTDRGDGTRLEMLGQQPTRPFRQHDVQVLPNGNITLFDNRTPFPFGATVTSPATARYVEYEIDDDDMTATVVRQYRRENGDNSGALGSARLQPGGGVVLNWGSVPGPTFTEVDADGEVLLEVTFAGDPVQRFSYRTIKEPLESFDIDELRATAGLG
ncbi:MAG: aryl-sulfate sulfotransferase [Ilumatobacteraceae bacterium]